MTTAHMTTTYVSIQHAFWCLVQFNVHTVNNNEFISLLSWKLDVYM